MHWNNGWHDSVGAGWWVFMALMMLAFFGGVIWLVVTLIRHGGGSSPPPAGRGTVLPPERPDPADILHERLARGEIDVDEYHQRIDALRAKRPD